MSQSPDISVLEYSANREESRFMGLSSKAWAQILLVAGLMCALFRFNLVRLWGKTNPYDGQDSNWQHSTFVPLIGLWYLYIHREELMAAVGLPVKREKGIRILAGVFAGLLALILLRLQMSGDLAQVELILGAALLAGLVVSVMIPTSTVFGTAMMLEGLLIFAYGIYPGQNDYVKDLGMVGTLFGVVTLLAGWPVMKVAWFPIAFLVVALPWPELVYSQLAWPLQQLAAKAAVGMLRLFNVEAHNHGTKIEYDLMKDGLRTPRMLNVAEACAGLRSMMTFLMVAGTVAFLQRRPLWEKLIITASAIPIAIICNMLRVAGQGLLDFYVSTQLAQGFAHSFVGLIMLIPGFFMILTVQWVLEKMLIEEVPGSMKGRGSASKSNRKIVEIPKKNVEEGSDSQGDLGGMTLAASAAGTSMAKVAPGQPYVSTGLKQSDMPHTSRGGAVTPAAKVPAAVQKPAAVVAAAVIAPAPAIKSPIVAPTTPAVAAAKPVVAKAAAAAQVNKVPIAAPGIPAVAAAKPVVAKAAAPAQVNKVPIAAQGIPAVAAAKPVVAKAAPAGAVPVPPGPVAANPPMARAGADANKVVPTAGTMHGATPAAMPVARATPMARPAVAGAPVTGGPVAPPSGLKPSSRTAPGAPVSGRPGGAGNSRGGAGSPAANSGAGGLLPSPVRRPANPAVPQGGSTLKPSSRPAGNPQAGAAPAGGAAGARSGSAPSAGVAAAGSIPTGLKQSTPKATPAGQGPAGEKNAADGEKQANGQDQ